MSEAEVLDQNSSHSYCSPPELSVTIPELSDLPQAIAPWKRVKIPTDVLLVTAKDCEFLSCFAFLRNALKSHKHGHGLLKRTRKESRYFRLLKGPGPPGLKISVPTISAHLCLAPIGVQIVPSRKALRLDG